MDTAPGTLKFLRCSFQVVNCSFDQSMDVRELTSLAKQIQLAYTQAGAARGDRGSEGVVPPGHGAFVSCDGGCQALFRYIVLFLPRWWC